MILIIGANTGRINAGLSSAGNKGVVGSSVKCDNVAGEWVTLSLPFDEFRLYSFGRAISDPPKLIPARVESVGVTIADKNPGAFQLDIEFIRAIGPAREGAKAGSNLTGIDGVNQDAGRQNPR